MEIRKAYYWRKDEKETNFVLQGVTCGWRDDSEKDKKKVAIGGGGWA